MFPFFMEWRATGPSYRLMVSDYRRPWTLLCRPIGVGEGDGIIYATKLTVMNSIQIPKGMIAFSCDLTASKIRSGLRVGP